MAVPEHREPPTAPIRPRSLDNGHDGLRSLSRSPHPYHRLNSELLEPADRIAYWPANQGRGTVEASGAESPHSLPSFARDSPIASESGTEADDEHLLKGLPAPRTRSHKGLRGTNERLSGASTPLSSPPMLEEEGHNTPLTSGHGGYEHYRRGVAEAVRRRKELVRRLTEVVLLLWQGVMVASNAEVRPFLRQYYTELLTLGCLFCILAALYPLRLVRWAYHQGTPSKLMPIHVPASFDPAPLLYPPLVPVLVSLLNAQNVKGAVLPSLVLSICALPRPLIPGVGYWEHFSCTHWLLSCIPFTMGKLAAATRASEDDEVPREVLVLLYPLHQTLCLILHHLTTTSLLISELQLLSVALISLLLLASSPQAVILKAVLWGGGLGLIVLCGQVIQWGITLARVPKWRFRRVAPSTGGGFGYQSLRQFLSAQRSCAGSQASYGGDSEMDRSVEASFGSLDLPPAPKHAQTDSISDDEPMPATLTMSKTVQFNPQEPPQHNPRRHTLPLAKKLDPGSKLTTPSGRRKRASSSSVRAFFSLTQTQATIRKWLYAGYVYLCIVLVIFAGVRLYVQLHALSNSEPIGWALGYLFGDLPQFRFQVVKADLERWIRLPPRPSSPDPSTTTTTITTTTARLPDHHHHHCATGGGWVQRARQTSLGAANTRLALSAYWLLTILTGLAVVLRLSPVCEVDTRRKVFHFMMVAMFLPTAYVDPAYAALALALVLAIFLLLDLLRASQLPPLSRPIARFLAPYVDGRDLRGPVVISHIFLLIGCAIPLWLSLASLPREAVVSGEGEGGMRGWEVAGREVAMVSGVVCVGLGDAAASLVGRRWGHRKWLWGGGKSIEGSLAFAGAVFTGLMVAAAWLRIGGWAVAGTSSASSGSPGVGQMGAPSSSGMDSLRNVLDLAKAWPWLRAEVPKTMVCASLASLTEAVLTGGNDNVVVPIVLWGCVKSLGV
ncbi:hypothetical protein N658DRAFT_419428 [Parathielavia hyrcaniae]|uniref:dolichol kinase n=1 Tax=Parathielavia hyrcaniae TaxID=113614 RepID=A0AAN6Q7A8_9PEZI|nr:hypothetical protein N658DRAFT_419428 [Parathielavia hyrcaniae]